MVVLALLFLLVPIAELYVIVRASQAFGVGETLVVLVGVSIVGAWLVKHQGLSILRRVVAVVRSGQMPHRELVDGALVLLSGALLLTPGFLTDALALALLVPALRAVVRTVVLARIAVRLDLLVVDARSWEPPAHDPGAGPGGS